MDPKTTRQAEMLANRLRKRRRHLKKWARRNGTGAYRLYDRDIPEIPLVMDLYSPAGDLADSNRLAGPALCGALYRRPYEKDEAEETLWLAEMKAAASQALEIPPEWISFRERKRLRNGERYSGRLETFRMPEQNAGTSNAETPGITLDTFEGGYLFRVNLTRHLDTGLFPDRRLLRARIGQESAGKRVLNLFAYTCSFSVYAAGGGAASVDSVDMSAAYLAWGTANFKLNGFFAAQLRNSLPAKNTEPFRFINADVLRFLPEARNAGTRWDLIILDPPAFSNSARMENTLDIQRDQRELLEQSLALLAPGGKLYFSVNARSFKPGTLPHFTDITEKFRDEDFKEKKIPSCYIFEK
jgi:23S rRNA G2069 N7-methylase RlmK/C1962 C5-methylase RlmI